MYASKLRITLLVLLSSATLSMAQRGSNQSTGTRSLSMGNVSSVLDNGDAIFNNFSNISFSPNQYGIILSSQRRFALEELTSAALGYYRRLGNNGNLGVSIRYYGFSEYKEQSITLSYARKLSDNLSISGNLDINELRLDELGSTSHLTYGIGLSGRINNQLRYSVYVFNPTNFEIADNSSSSAYLQIGFSSLISDKLTLLAEIEKVIEESINIKMGFQYSLVTNFGIRAGFSSNPGQPSFGFYYYQNDIIADFGVHYDLNLGVTPSVAIKYNLSKR